MAKILIVDDEAKTRSHLIQIISSLGHEVYEAENGDECLEILKNKQIDLLILDLRMPRKNGVETLINLRNKKKLKKMIITGVLPTDSEAVDELYSLFKVDEIIFKPFKKEELICKINSLGF